MRNEKFNKFSCHFKNLYTFYSIYTFMSWGKYMRMIGEVSFKDNKKNFTDRAKLDSWTI